MSRRSTTELHLVPIINLMFYLTMQSSNFIEYMIKNHRDNQRKFLAFGGVCFFTLLFFVWVCFLLLLVVVVVVGVVVCFVFVVFCFVLFCFVFVFCFLFVFSIKCTNGFIGSSYNWRMQTVLSAEF